MDKVSPFQLGLLTWCHWYILHHVWQTQSQVDMSVVWNGITCFRKTFHILDLFHVKLPGWCMRNQVKGAKYSLRNWRKPTCKHYKGLHCIKTSEGGGKCYSFKKCYLLNVMEIPEHFAWNQCCAYYVCCRT